MLDETRKQVAALPYRSIGNRLEVMLITSRGTGRWVIPKGWPMRDRKPWEAAAREAFEEAGIVGNVSSKRAGDFRYDKELKNGAVVPCEVDVYPLQVQEELVDWPEQGQRTRRWYAPEAAEKLVDESGLKQLLARLKSPAELE